MRRRTMLSTGLAALAAWSTIAAGATAQSRADELLDAALAAQAVGVDEPQLALVEAGTSVLDGLVARLDALRPSPAAGIPEGPEFELIAIVLEALPRPEVQRALEPETDTDDSARCARIGALSTFGTAADLNLLIALAGPCEQDGRLTTAVETAVAAIHRRSPATFRGIASVFLTASWPLREAIVRGIGAVQRLDSVEALADLLDLAPPLDPLILAHLGRIGSLEPLAVSERVRGRVRRLLDLEHEDPRLREAALVVGRLEDSLALDRLITLLGSESTGVRGNAHWSLRHVSGLPIGPDRIRWLTWLRSNERWWAEDWPQTRAALRGGDRADASEAIRTVAGRRYRRHELAQELLHVLRRSDDEVLVAYTCLALASLDSPVAYSALVELLDDGRTLIRQRAHDALRSLTGIDLPADAAQWHEALPRFGLTP